MQLDVKEIGEPLRGVAPDVFEELELAERVQDHSVGIVTVEDVAGGSGLSGCVVVEDFAEVCLDGEKDTGVVPEVGSDSPLQKLVEHEDKAESSLADRTKHLPPHLTPSLKTNNL